MIVFGHNEDARAKLVGFGPRADKWDGNKAGETVLGGIFDDIGVFTLRDGTNCIPDAVSRVFDIGNQELASKEGNIVRCDLMSQSSKKAISGSSEEDRKETGISMRQSRRNYKSVPSNQY